MSRKLTRTERVLLWVWSTADRIYEWRFARRFAKAGDEVDIPHNGLDRLLARIAWHCQVEQEHISIREWERLDGVTVASLR